MPHYVRKYDFEEIIAAVREILLDVGPVASFKITGQGLSFTKTATTIGFGGGVYPIGQMPKVYGVVSALQGAGYGVELLPDYYGLAETERIEECAYADLGTAGKVVMMKEFFSKKLITRYLEDYCRVYGFRVEDRYLEDVVNKDFDFLNSRKACYWVAYWLVDVRRSAAARYKSVYKGDPTEGGAVNTTKDITVTIGEVFRITERQEPGNERAQGFTAIWGDLDSYWSRLQLYLRQQFERLFDDYSLRDNVGKSLCVPMTKHWSPFGYVNTFDFSQTTKDIFG